MKPCYDEGTLRAYLDRELDSSTQCDVAAHVSMCDACQQQLGIMHVQVRQVQALLHETVRPPEPQHIWYRLQQATQDEPCVPIAPFVRRKQMKNQRWSGRFRPVMIGIVILVALVSLLALPPMRAIADQFLQVFRVQKVMFVPIDSDRMEQLKQLDFDGKTLFVGDPEVIKDVEGKRTVATKDEAASAVGYALHQPQAFPTAPYSTTFAIHGSGSFRFQLNVDSLRHLLELMDVTDVTIPDALGEYPITVNLTPSAIVHYYGSNYELMLIQGKSPDVRLPEGVDLSQVGKAALRLLGMDSIQAEALSKNIDWSTTLLFPIPADVGSIRQVTIGEGQGLLTNREYARGRHNTEMTKQLYWQQGDHFYVMMSSGRLSNDDLVALAQSVQ